MINLLPPSCNDKVVINVIHSETRLDIRLSVSGKYFPWKLARDVWAVQTIRAMMIIRGPSIISVSFANRKRVTRRKWRRSCDSTRASFVSSVKKGSSRAQPLFQKACVSLLSSIFPPPVRDFFLLQTPRKSLHWLCEITFTPYFLSLPSMRLLAFLTSTSMRYRFFAVIWQLI